MDIIDINEKLNTYLDEKLSDILKDGQNKTEDELEELIDELTDRWINRPHQWLDNKTLSEYFSQFNSAEQLSGMFLKYLAASYEVPDVLIYKMIDKKEEVYPLLTFALKQFLNAGEDKENICINIISFFNEAQ